MYLTNNQMKGKIVAMYDIAYNLVMDYYTAAQADTSPCGLYHTGLGGFFYGQYQYNATRTNSVKSNMSKQKIGGVKK